MPKRTAEWNRRYFMSESYEDTDDVIEICEYKDNDVYYHVTIRGFFSSWGPVNQVAIKKKSEKSKEPSMSEKIFVLEGLRVFHYDEIALEIFPKKSNIVDDLDIYHVWVVGRRHFPCYIPKIKKECPIIWKRVTIDGKELFYQKRKQRVFGKKVIFFYVKSKDGLELSWYEKQNFKDFIIGKNVIAVESVEKKTSKTAALICIPESIGNMPFGLKKCQSKKTI